jgi:hypothetical protein
MTAVTKQGSSKKRYCHVPCPDMSLCPTRGEPWPEMQSHGGTNPRDPREEIKCYRLEVFVAWLLEMRVALYVVIPLVWFNARK